MIFLEEEYRSCWGSVPARLSVPGVCVCVCHHIYTSPFLNSSTKKVIAKIFRFHTIQPQAKNKNTSFNWLVLNPHIALLGPFTRGNIIIQAARLLITIRTAQISFRTRVRMDDSNPPQCRRGPMLETRKRAAQFLRKTEVQRIYIKYTQKSLENWGIQKTRRPILIFGGYIKIGY